MAAKLICKVCKHEDDAKENCAQMCDFSAMHGFSHFEPTSTTICMAIRNYAKYHLDGDALGR